MVPDVEAGNLIYKVLAHFARVPLASVLTGSRVPIALPGRADSTESKYLSACLVALLGAAEKAG